MYEKPACGDYQVQFRMVSNKGLDTVVAVDSFLNNAGTYQLSANGKRLMRPQAGGYRLRFALPDGATAADSLRICADAFKMSYRCVGCAAGGSDAIFGPTDIDMLCPYNTTANNDLLACYRRSSREGNWEAWISDPRDCQPYRIVLMPDNRWWFARNLSFTDDLINSGDSNVSGTNDLWGNYWCPGGLTITNGGEQTNLNSASPATNVTTTTGGMTACKTYGALYTWNTTIRLNGHGMEHAPTKVGNTSTTQGICPDGWLLPSDFDWGVMLNAVEGCPKPSEQSEVAPCNHLYNDTRTNGWFGANAASRLKSTVSAPPHNLNDDATIATATNPAWPWRRADYSGKTSTPEGLGDDRYGFSLLPAGYRHPTLSTNTGFTNLGNAAYLWSSTESSASNRAFHRRVDYQHAGVGRSTEFPIGQKWAGLSVRCVRDVLPNAITINAPNTVSYLSNAMEVSFGRNESTWTYTWSVSSSEISNIESKVTFATNGTSAANRTTSTLAFDKADEGKSFTLKLTVSDGTNTRTLTKEIRIAAIAVTIKVNTNSVGGVVTATAQVDGAGKYTYAWGVGNQSYSTNNTSTQTILTAEGTPPQAKTWYLKVMDIKSGVESEQISTTYTFPAIPTGTTYCNACANDGQQNVDVWLVPMSDTGRLADNLTYGLANATDINNGKLNTQRLLHAGAAGAGLYACIGKGEGWYVPAAEEYCRIKAAGLASKVLPEKPNIVNNNNIIHEAWLSTIQTASKETMGISCWFDKQPSGNGPGISTWKLQSLDDKDTMDGENHVLCVWRPD